jgi:hypothetical protein
MKRATREWVRKADKDYRGARRLEKGKSRCMTWPRSVANNVLRNT